MTSATIAIEQFLTRRFTPAEFHQFAHHTWARASPDDEDVVALLPEPRQEPAAYFFAVALLIERLGLADAQFFRSLLTERSNFAWEVNQLELTCGSGSIEAAVQEVWRSLPHGSFLVSCASTTVAGRFVSDLQRKIEANLSPSSTADRRDYLFSVISVDCSGPASNDGLWPVVVEELHRLGGRVNAVEQNEDLLDCCGQLITELAQEGLHLVLLLEHAECLTVESNIRSLRRLRALNQTCAYDRHFGRRFSYVMVGSPLDLSVGMTSPVSHWANDAQLVRLGVSNRHLLHSPK